MKKCNKEIVLYGLSVLILLNGCTFFRRPLINTKSSSGVFQEEKDFDVVYEEKVKAVVGQESGGIEIKYVFSWLSDKDIYFYYSMKNVTKDSTITIHVDECFKCKDNQGNVLQMLQTDKSFKKILKLKANERIDDRIGFLQKENSGNTFEIFFQASKKAKIISRKTGN